MWLIGLPSKYLVRHMRSFMQVRNNVQQGQFGEAGEGVRKYRRDGVVVESTDDIKPR